MSTKTSPNTGHGQHGFNGSDIAVAVAAAIGMVLFWATIVHLNLDGPIGGTVMKLITVGH